MLSNTFKISKGHNLSLVGNPKNKIIDVDSPSSIIVHPMSIYGIKTKLLIKEGENVNVGTPLFYDKNNPEAYFVSSCSGKIKNVVYGKRRSIKSIHIDNDHKYDVKILDRQISKEALLKSGLWTYLRQRPFSKIPISDSSPKSIFISALPTQPFAIKLDYLFNYIENYLQDGLEALKKIFKCDINFVSSEKSFLKNLKNVNHYTFNDLHPAGNVGIQIHHIDPIQNAHDTRWYLSLQDLNRIGQFFKKEDYPIYKYVSIGGDGFDNPAYYKNVLGTPISKLVRNDNNNCRIISGDVLSGKISNYENSLNYYDEILSVINTSYKREFLGWMKLGFNKYSISNAFLSKIFNMSLGKLDAKLNGSVRTIIPMGNWDNVLPMNILPEFLIKNILIKDIDMMEKLGIYECDAEDFSLCAFSCQSKVEVSSIIEEGLRLIEKEI